MHEMLRRLFQWLQKFLRRLFDSKQISSNSNVRQLPAVQLPELTNADLEFLFTQLLEGVHQGRGQGWATRYIQRMENRITQQRWLEWLLNFAEKLLSSPAPNHELAYRMVQLGELRIGDIGDLAYDIGMKLLTRNLDELYEPEEELVDENDLDYYTSVVPQNLPEESVTGFVGEVIWDFDEQDSESIVPPLNLSISPQVSFDEKLGEVNFWEEEGTESFISTNQENVNKLGEIPPWEQEEPVNESRTIERDILKNLRGLVVREENTEDVTSSDSAEYNETFYTSQSFWGGENSSEIETATSSEFAYLPDRVSDPPVYPDPHGVESEITPPEEAQTGSEVENLDESTEEFEPVVAVTLDELSIRLQQSADLVEQLAAYGLLGKGSPQARTESENNQTDVSLQAQAWFYKGLGQAKTGDLMTALGSYDQAISMKPDVYEYWFNRALTLFHLGDFAAALASYDQAINIKEDAYKGWYNRGITLGELGGFADAVTSFDRAIEIKPDYYEAWSSRGLALVQLGHLAEAIESYNQAVHLQPQDQDNWYCRGLALLEKGDYLSAIASFDKVLEIDPASHLAWYNRGVGLWNLNRWQDAITSLDRAIEIEPLSEQVWYIRGNALDKMGQTAQALASYQQASQIEPDYHEVWIDRGVVLFKMSRWAEAINAWDRAIQIKPDFYLAWFNRAVALEQLGRYDEALASYDQSIEINPDFYLAWYNRAVVLSNLQRFEEAIAHYDRTLEIKPDYWEAWIARGTAAGNSTAYDRRFELFSKIPSLNLELNQRGYAGKLASYETALQYISQESYPQGWGRLHLALGHAHYDRGKKHPTPHYYWQQAIEEYNQALLTLRAANYPELHLEVLQDKIKVLLSLGETEAAEKLQESAIELWQSLLNEPARSPENKKQLALKFACLWQYGVDFSMKFGEFVQALEIAEHAKNACLNWQLYGWQKQIISPRYEDVQTLINPTTAIVYWHVSPCAIHTFVIKDKASEPMLIFTPVAKDIEAKDDFPQREAMLRLIEFEDWQINWQQQYQEYSSNTDESHNKREHSWRVDMEQRLLKLRDILNIPAIEQELQGIEQLILIPHSDLHRYPLHSLFNRSFSDDEDLPNVDNNFSITYLPSAQVGLSLASKPKQDSSMELLLSVENPESTGHLPLKFAKLESEVIANMFHRPTQIEGLEASKQTVENALYGGYNIFHFAGYAIDNSINPLNSELVLAGEDKLTLAQICNKSLEQYNLLTISGGKTADYTKQNISNEYVGFVNTFLCQGVTNIVSTLWVVESTATALVMIEFYRRIKAGKSAANALTETTQWVQNVTALELTKWYQTLLNELPVEGLRIRAHLATLQYRISKIPFHKKPYNNPYYWAGFIVAGK